MPRGYITLVGGQRWRIGHCLDVIEYHLERLRPRLEDELARNAAMADPGFGARVQVMHLGVSQKDGTTPEAYRDANKTVYHLEDLQPRFQPYCQMLEDQGWQTEVRDLSPSPSQSGLHVYIVGPPTPS